MSPITECLDPLLLPNSLWLLNARSAVKHASLICDLLTDCSPSVCALTETWFRPGHSCFPQDIAPTDYDLISKPREHQHGGGVAFLIKRDLKPRQWDLSNCSFSSFEVLACKCIINGHSTTLIVIYRPPPNSPQFIDDFSHFCEFMISHCNKFILLGDFNIHVNDLSDSFALAFLDLLTFYNLSLVSRAPTHSHGNCLDLFISKDCQINTLSACKLSWADHVLLGCHPSGWAPSLPTPPVPPLPLSICLKRNWSHLSPFQADRWSTTAGLSFPVHDSSPALASDTLMRKWSLMADSVCPPKRTRFRPRAQGQACWFSPALQELKRQGRRLERAWRKSQLPADKERCNRHTRFYKTAIDSAKRSFLASSIANAQHKSRALFKLYRDFTHAHNISPLPESTELCNNIADFFKSKIDKIRSTIVASDSNNLPSMSTPSPPPLRPLFSEFTSLSEADMLHCLSKLGPSSSPLDPLPTAVVKAIAPVIAPDLTMLINSSFSQGLVPSSWKSALVTPLLKKPGLDPLDFKNLRPISQLPLLARLSESIAVSQFQTHCETHGLLHDLQSGFRPGRGTESALIDIQEQLLGLKDRGHPSALVLLDLSAAFDTVDHDILLFQLERRAGISGTALAWCRSFLSGRSQQVRIGSGRSGAREVTCGVPQGSSLSPFMFNVYMRPLADLLEESGLGWQMFADDTQIVVDLLDRGSGSGGLATCLERVKDWMGRNRLLLNEGKTEILLSAQQSPLGCPSLPWPLSFGPPPPPAEAARTLGVLFNQARSGSSQVAAVTRSAHFQLNALVPLMPLLTLEHRSTLCQALALSKISYCSTLYAGLTGRDCLRLQRVQNRAVRMVMGLRRFDHVSGARRSLGWLKISDQIKLRCLVTMWRSLHLQGPKYLQSRFTWASSIRPQRPHLRGRVSVPTFLKSRGLGSALSRVGPRWWNALPATIRLAPSAALFKRLVKTHLSAADT